MLSHCWQTIDSWLTADIDASLTNVIRSTATKLSRSFFFFLFRVTFDACFLRLDVEAKFIRKIGVEM